MKKQIVVFSDAHYSKNWDTIDHCLTQEENQYTDYLNPNKELRNFVNLMNASPNVEAVLNNGDSVDYHFCDFNCFPDITHKKNDRLRSTNHELFNSLISRLDKRYYAVPGNHDYRKEPYSYAIWGTDQINLPGHIRKKYKRRIGHHLFRGPFELASILVNENFFDPLSRSLHLKKRQDMKISDFHCVFLDTGSDAFVRSRNMLKWLIKTIKYRNFSCDLDGLEQEDIDYLSRVLAKEIKNDILIFQHAPLINSRTGSPGKTYQLSIDDFYERNRKQGIACDTILNGGSRLLHLLSSSEKNIAIISSHTHKARYYLINKKTLRAREVTNEELNREKDNREYIKHISTLPLGGISPAAQGYCTGFLRISPAGYEETTLRRFN